MASLTSDLPGTGVETPSAELAWLAFAYVSGDLEGGELESFEARLADGELAACEAVADAVVIISAVGSSGPSALPGERSLAPVRRIREHNLLTLLSPVVALVLVVSLAWRTPTPVASRVEFAGGEDVLLSTWADGTPSALDDVSGGAESGAVVAETDLVVPEWMMLAVGLAAEMEGGIE